MKKLIGSFLLGLGILTATLLHAQPPGADTLATIESADPISPDSLPRFGNFYSLAHPTWPPLPSDFGMPAWQVSSNSFVVDDIDYAPMTMSSMMSFDGLFPTNVAEPEFVYNPPTNGLYLEMVSVTNSHANLIVHGTVGGINYQILSEPSLTNGVPVTNWNVLTEIQGSIGTNWTAASVLTNGQPMEFFSARTAPTSTGTDFWLAFFNLSPDLGAGGGSNSLLSLSISSVTTNSGTVTYPVYGTNMTVTGDPGVNGTYIRTNASTADMGSLYPIDPVIWVNSTNQEMLIISQFGQSAWVIVTNYIPFEGHSYPYYSLNFDPNGTNWFDENGLQASIAVSCPLVYSNQSFTVAAGGMTNIIIPTSSGMDAEQDFDKIELKGVHLTANAPVSVYGLDYLKLATGAFTAYSTPMLGTNYCLMSQPSYIPAYIYQYTNFSQFLIVGTQTNTTVWITPSATANLNGSLWSNSITLQQGQVYQINGSDYTDDVTGTRIVSDKPVAVFAGTSDANVPDENTGTDNPLVQEQIPVDQWETNTLALGFAGRGNGDSYCVLAAYTNTMVWTNGVLVGVTNAGQHFDLIISGPVQFQSTQPIQVARFANGRDFDATSNLKSDPREGDPCEVLLLPIGQYLETNIVVTLPNDNVVGDFNENFLNLIVPQSATNAVSLDGSTVSPTNFIPILSSGYYGAQITITNSGTHTVKSSQPVGVEAYGWGIADAYSYFGGMVK